jgi:hypothetical protein
MGRSALGHTDRSCRLGVGQTALGPLRPRGHGRRTHRARAGRADPRGVAQPGISRRLEEQNNRDRRQLASRRSRGHRLSARAHASPQVPRRRAGSRRTGHPGADAQRSGVRGALDAAKAHELHVRSLLLQGAPGQRLAARWVAARQCPRVHPRRRGARRDVRRAPARVSLALWASGLRTPRRRRAPGRGAPDDPAWSADQFVLRRPQPAELRRGLSRRASRLLRDSVEAAPAPARPGPRALRAARRRRVVVHPHRRLLPRPALPRRAVHRRGGRVSRGGSARTARKRRNRRW